MFTIGSNKWTSSSNILDVMSFFLLVFILFLLHFTAMFRLFLRSTSMHLLNLSSWFEFRVFLSLRLVA